MTSEETCPRSLQLEMLDCDQITSSNLYPKVFTPMGEPFLEIAVVENTSMAFSIERVLTPSLPLVPSGGETPFQGGSWSALSQHPLTHAGVTPRLQLVCKDAICGLSKVKKTHRKF